MRLRPVAEYSNGSDDDAVESDCHLGAAIFAAPRAVRRHETVSSSNWSLLACLKARSCKSACDERDLPYCSSIRDTRIAIQVPSKNDFRACKRKSLRGGGVRSAKI